MNNGFNISFLIGGLVAGLSVGALCLTTCSCLLLPMFLSARQNLRKSFYAFLTFSAGRLLAYVIFGAVAGWVGSEFSSFPWFNWVIAAGYLTAALFLLHYINRDSHICDSEKKSNKFKKKSVPFILGVTTGLNFCPPFVIAATVAIQTKSAFWGSLFFFAFFLGTSVYLFPLIFAGVLSRWTIWRKIGKLAGTIVGFVYIFIALSTFHSLLYPETSVDLDKIIGSDCKNIKLIDTREFKINAIGYAGKTPLILMICDSGIISNIFLLKNQESDYVIKPISKWLEQWHNNSTDFLLENLNSVDGVSGATMTIDALRENLYIGATRFLTKENYTDNRLRTTGHGPRTTDHPGMRGALGPRATDYRFAKTCLPFVILFIIAILVTKIQRLQKLWLRWCLWILAVLLLGFYRSTFFSIGQISLLISGNIPPLINISWYAVFLITIISPLFFGRAYCKYVCPFGALSEICYRIVPGSLSLPPFFVRYFKYVKYILLVIVLLAVVVFPEIPAEKFEPFHAAFTRNQSRAYFIFGVSVLIVSCFIKRFWCSFFCIDGALFESIKGKTTTNESQMNH
ncbi:sulfite exporter TauE/SafE family protein [bacterium]|nr:sulfite exporter TauE/SafE family protein [bacterium]